MNGSESKEICSMEKDLSLLCKSRDDEKILKFEVLKTIGNDEAHSPTFPEVKWIWKSLFLKRVKFKDS